MNWSIFLAHGALGPYDELFLPLIGGVFLTLLIVTWLRSRTPPNSDSLPISPATKPRDPQNQNEDDNHFTLD